MYTSDIKSSLLLVLKNLKEFLLANSIEPLNLSDIPSLI